MKLAEHGRTYEGNGSRVVGSSPEVVLGFAPILCQFHIFHPFFL